ncbi:MAG: hypothetical protein K2H34_06190, partial [Lachnospiraceae bacterium]|nr:hypothetical protein [Lachnospiraceae bacterium]
SLADLDGPGNATYTINSNLFSTYALVYSMDRTQEPENPPVNIGDGTGTTGPSTNGSIHVNDPGIDNGEIPIDSTQSPAQSGNTNSTFGSLRSNGSAKTGDAAPVAAAAFIMMTALGGMIVLKKKSRQCD